MRVAEWSPRVGIRKDESEFVMKADLPEARTDDVKGSLENNVLIFRGKRKVEKEEKRKRYHRIERFCGGCWKLSFARPSDECAASFSSV